MVGGTYTPIGFNAWRETDGKLSIGECTEQDKFRIEGTDLIMRGVDAPSGFWDCNDAQEQDNIIQKNLRTVLQLSNIRAHIFSDRIEIQGAIPEQVLDMTGRKQSPCVPIIGSARGTKGEGYQVKNYRDEIIWKPTVIGIIVSSKKSAHTRIG